MNLEKSNDLPATVCQTLTISPIVFGVVHKVRAVETEPMTDRNVRPGIFSRAEITDRKVLPGGLCRIGRRLRIKQKLCG